MQPTIESLEQELKKRILRIADLEKENYALTAENHLLREVLNQIRSSLRNLGTKVKWKPL